MNSVDVYTEARNFMGHYLDLVLTAVLEEIDFTYVTNKSETIRRTAVKYIRSEDESRCYNLILEAIVNYAYFNAEDLSYADIRDIAAAAIDVWNETIKTELTKGFIILDDGGDMLSFLADMCLEIQSKLEHCLEKNEVMKYAYVIKLTDDGMDSVNVFGPSPIYEIQIWFYEMPEEWMFDARV